MTNANILRSDMETVWNKDWLSEGIHQGPVYTATDHF